MPQQGLEQLQKDATAVAADVCNQAGIAVDACVIGRTRGDSAVRARATKAARGTGVEGAVPQKRWTGRTVLTIVLTIVVDVWPFG